jgi:hypothetical protein
LPLKDQSPSPVTGMSPLDLGSPLLGSPSPPPSPIALFSENVTPRSPARTARLERELGLTTKKSARQIFLAKRGRVAPAKFFGDQVRGTISGEKSRVWEVQVKEATDKKLLLQKRGDPVIGLPVFD